MDKFDEVIKNTKQTPEPTSNFVEATMQQVEDRQPRKRRNLKIWVPAIAGGLVVIALLLVVIPTGHVAAPKAVTSGNTSATTPAKQGSTTGSTATPAVGTDNASLDNDLTGIKNSTNQENADQGSANSAVNDSQNEIAVPTS